MPVVSDSSREDEVMILFTSHEDGSCGFGPPHKGRGSGPTSHEDEGGGRETEVVGGGAGGRLIALPRKL